MWKLCTLGSLIILINTFGNVDGESQRFQMHRGPNGRRETFVERVNRNGYFAEEHFVTTEDGYVLHVDRIFGGPKSPPSPKKQMVLLLHGMIASSGVWVLRGPGEDLAYLLVDEGFDVWMLNVRGNTFSRQNTRLAPNNPEFWRFSWHEIGVYDVPATIDYMLAHTGLSTVTVAGHSMGSTNILVLLSKRPEYNEKIDLVILLAPTAIFTRLFRGPITLLIQFGGEALNSFRRTGTYEVLPHTQIFRRVAADFCSRPRNHNICKLAFYLATGSSDIAQFNDEIIEFLLEYFPAGTSVDTIDHYLQNIYSASFREFDFGVFENYARYGTSYPPEYPLWKVTAPVLIYSGLNDLYVQPPDVRALEKRLPNIVGSKVVADKSFTHFDFVISRNTKELLYDDIIENVRKYKSEATRRFQ